MYNKQAIQETIVQTLSQPSKIYEQNHQTKLLNKVAQPSHQTKASNQVTKPSHQTKSPNQVAKPSHQTKLPLPLPFLPLEKKEQRQTV